MGSFTIGRECNCGFRRWFDAEDARLNFQGLRLLADVTIGLRDARAEARASAEGLLSQQTAPQRGCDGFIAGFGPHLVEQPRQLSDRLEIGHTQDSGDLTSALPICEPLEGLPLVRSNSK
jgi:hypothetical protein